MIFSRRMALAFLGSTSIFLTGQAFAGEYKAFNGAAFASAQKASKKIVVFFYAPWCPYCLAQKPILLSLLKEPKYKDFVIFEVDYDTSKQTSRDFNITQQSTILVFKGAKELSRNYSVTVKADIAASLDLALG